MQFQFSLSVHWVDVVSSKNELVKSADRTPKVDSRTNQTSLSSIFQNPWIIGILYYFHRCSEQIKSGNMTSINGSKCHWKSISLVVCLLVCVVGTSNVWQENVRPKLYVELGEYIHWNYYYCYYSCFLVGLFILKCYTCFVPLQIQTWSPATILYS